MRAVERNTRIIRLIAFVVAGGIAMACGGGPGSERSGTTANVGIPAPDSSLTDNSSVLAFLQYGDSLQFAADTPGVVTVNRLADSVNAELRVRSEVRLPFTDSTAYIRGRIVMKYETVRASSPYGTPVGNAYLWVRDTGGGNFRGVLMWRNYVTGDTGRTAVPYYGHSSPIALRRGAAECADVSIGGSDTTGICCLCSDGRFNCPMTQFVSMGGLDSLVRQTGRAR